jgi:hypothetical protein
VLDVVEYLCKYESSESDGDTDAMCGNVLPITNCMEYLHSYTTPTINEDQLMKTKSSKLKDNEHRESVFCSAMGTLSISSHGELVKDLLFFIN